jgi:hypothetical protein
VHRSLTEAAEGWVIDDAWPVAEAVELLKALPGDESLRTDLRQRLSSDVTPRLVVSLDGLDGLVELRRQAPDVVVLPPVVLVDIADREAALMEIAAALDAAA